MVEIRFPEFPIHIPITNNKKAPNKYVKVNAQSIYNGAIARFGRAAAVKNLHEYFLSHIKESVMIDYPVKIKFIIKTVINHGSISRRNGKICWNYRADDYIPNWDIENLASIFIKTGIDSLVKAGTIPDDSVQYVKNIEYEFQEVDTLEDREIIVVINRKE